MPFIGIGLHFVIALFFAIHAIKTGRPLYWLIILFSFPLLGSVVYFFAEYLPTSRMERSLNKVSNKAIQLLDPTRELREAQAAFDLTSTIENRMRLAAALDNAGHYDDAEKQFDACLHGPFAGDPNVCLGAASAKLHVRKTSEAIELLQNLRDKKADFRAEQVSILLAKCHAVNQDKERARAEFVHALNTFGSAEVRGEYALWAAQNDDLITAERLRADLQKDWQRWNSHSRGIHRALFKQIDDAITTARKVG